MEPSHYKKSSWLIIHWNTVILLNIGYFLGDSVQQVIGSDPSDIEGFVKGTQRISSDVPVTGDYG